MNVGCCFYAHIYGHSFGAVPVKYWNNRGSLSKTAEDGDNIDKIQKAHANMWNTADIYVILVMGFDPNQCEILNAARGIWNPHKDLDTPSNPVTSILNVFYYSLIITCVFCASYKVEEGFECSREELGVKDEQHIDFEISCIMNFEVSDLKVLLAHL